MNWKGYGRQRSRLNLKCYPSVYLETLRKKQKVCARTACLQAEI
jgi:hypothetical protein